MDQQQARNMITDWAREQYGHFIEVREVLPLRKATGRVWVGKLYCTIREGDVFIGRTLVNDVGKIIEQMDVDTLVDALVSVRTSETTTLPVQEEDFGLADDLDFSSLADEAENGDGDMADGVDGIDDVFSSLDSEALHQKAIGLIATGEEANLIEARNILPQLLSSQQRRGAVLEQMASLEILLGDTELGLRHLEASAREFADMANLEGLARVTEMASSIMDEKQFFVSEVRSLFEQTRNKMRPLEAMNEAPLFVGILEEELDALKKIATTIQVGPGDIVLKEGDLANEAFIVKNGALSVRLDSPDGSSKVVRSCFPGDFIGESSVLGPSGATCTATVQGGIQGDDVSELWRFDGGELRELSTKYPDVRMRIESAKTLHQLDSFISMNESTSTLDVSMRDQLLSCISGLGRVAEGDILNPKGLVPTSIHLIVSGVVNYVVDGKVVRTYAADTFVGLRDALHKLPLSGDFVTATDCLLVYMDPERLCEIADGAPPEVIAVLEKLE